MKIIKRIVIAIFLITLVSSCEGKPTHIKLTVVDELGEPIEGADVKLIFSLDDSANEFRGKTNSKGIVSAIRMGSFGTGIFITKDGYYRSRKPISSGSQEVTVLLRQKKNPVAMYAKTVLNPYDKFDRGVWFGYDFFVGDWVAPYGKGVVSDFEARVTSSGEDIWTFKYEKNIRFPNGGDGLISFNRTNSVSDLISDYYAPSSGYQSEWNFYRNSDGVGTPINTNTNKYQNYYFRIRTQYDDNGKIESAYYGKIYGEIGFITKSISYYLNSNENDRKCRV